MIIGVFGPRDFRQEVGGEQKSKYYDNYPYIAGCLEDYDAKKIISGGGHGVEQLALRYAVEQAIEFQVVPPNRAAHGQSAFFVRNAEIIKMTDLVVLFWDGKDRFYHQFMAEVIGAKKVLHVFHVE